MSQELQSLLIGLAAGGAGYLVATFWFQPILRYREIRERVHSDLIYFADATNADGLNAAMVEKMWARVGAYRRHSSDLRANYELLAWWYRTYLKLKGHQPLVASARLMGFSNNFKHDDAPDIAKQIRKNLNLPR